MPNLTRQSIEHFIQLQPNTPKTMTKTTTNTTASKSISPSKSPRLFRRSNNHLTRLSSSSDRSEEDDVSDPKNPVFLSYGLKYPDFSIKTHCPHCNKYVRTIVQHENGTCVYVLASGLFLTTVVLFWVPFFMDAVKDVKHSCPNCRNYLGTRHRL
ncbi:5414_t:CDS:2 [Ambispora leptoticha]|uniref:5414_t:CDS:1 n=1 Tax=Ambispora leptoticha TaxID=144679 RepID=A0A9N8WL61_9GLOM|nr:5414_t:CDS:2 [Ambispora leptoticha]